MSSASARLGREGPAVVDAGGGRRATRVALQKAMASQTATPRAPSTRTTRKRSIWPAGRLKPRRLGALEPQRPGVRSSVVERDGAHRPRSALRRGLRARLAPGMSRREVAIRSRPRRPARTSLPGWSRPRPARRLVEQTTRAWLTRS